MKRHGGLLLYIALLAPAFAMAQQPLAAPTMSGAGSVLSWEKATDLPAPAVEEGAERRVLVMLRLPPEHYRPSGDYGSAGGYGNAAAARARRRLAARIARDNHLILIDAWPMPVLGIDCVIMRVPGDEPLEAVTYRLGHDRDVAWSQPMNRFEARSAAQAPPASMGTVPNDRLFAAQPAAHGWRLADLHRIASGRGVRVAVIDSMVDRLHPDLQGQLSTVQDFTGSPPVSAEAHGTGVAGVIAAAENNRLGIAGVAPGARIMGLRACWQSSIVRTVCDSLSLARALVFALENGAGVINMSLTGPHDQLIARLVNVALRRNVSVVAAVDPASGGGFPASLAGVTAVASNGLATTRPGVYSAPGRDVPTTEPGGRWGLVNGNSFAAAHVSGLLALARQLKGPRAALVSVRQGGGSVDACATVFGTNATMQGRCRPDR